MHLAFLLFSPGISSVGCPVRLIEPVIDLSGRLPEGGTAGLSGIIRELEADNGPKLKVLLITDSGEETLSAFAERTLALQPEDLRPDALLVLSVSPPPACIASADKARRALMQP